MTDTTNKYLVIGTRNQLGAIGTPDSFQQVIEAPSSRDAYMTVLNDPSHERIHVIAIRMRCENCHTYHVEVDTKLWLGI